MDRLYVRGRNNAQKRLLIQAAACNLALLMRTLYGAGKPRAAHDRPEQLVFAILRLHSVLTALRAPESAFFGDQEFKPRCPHSRHKESWRTSKTTV
jgi:hypothetical protein